MHLEFIGIKLHIFLKGLKSESSNKVVEIVIRGKTVNFAATSQKIHLENPEMLNFLQILQTNKVVLSITRHKT